MDESLLYKPIINSTQMSNNINTEDVENSINSSLIDNMNNKIKKFESQLHFYKHITCYMSVIIIFLILMLLYLLLNIK